MLDAALSLSAGTAARIITLVALAGITRLYGPGDLGAWAIVFSVANLLSPLASLRYEIAVVIAETPAQARALIRLVALCFDGW